jgi:hypothetical protein
MMVVVIMLIDHGGHDDCNDGGYMSVIDEPLM